ncbi:MAG: hypothetical protein MPJ50_16465 [Pirellulales bacterium]|nr:hypothetical protein [Pirellulales bacterium]
MTKVEGIFDLETDPSTTTATFRANKDVDVGQLLDDLSETNDHISGWSQNTETEDLGDTEDSSDTTDGSHAP